MKDAGKKEIKGGMRGERGKPSGYNQAIMEKRSGGNIGEGIKCERSMR